MSSESLYDSIIIGGGPAGLAVANCLQRENINCIIIEKKHIAYNVSRFPICMTFFSGRKLLEIGDYDLTIPDDKPTREQYLTYLFRFAKRKNLKIRDYTNVLEVKKENNIFLINVENPDFSKDTLKSRSVVLACGALDNPQMLDIKGENLPHVNHYFTEVYPYAGHNVLIIGSGNSAVETALKLYRAGSHVSLSHRENSLSESKIKYWLYPDIMKRLEKNEITHYPNTIVTKIFNQTSHLQNSESGKEIIVENDFVLALTGYLPPLNFLRSMGIEIHENTSVPVHNNVTHETNVEGIFVAGAITGGNISGKVFIENSRDHGEMILPRLKEILK